MSPAQRTLFFSRLWPAACRAAGWNADDRELRLEMLSRWLHKPILSIGQITRQRDIDHIFSACQAISADADLEPQLRAQDQPRARLIHRITNGAPESYWRALARDKFQCDDLAELTELQLTQLRDTLVARGHCRKPSTF